MIQYTEEQLQAALLTQQNTHKAKYLSTKTYGNDEDCHAVLDNGVPYTAIVQHCMVTQLALNLYLNETH
jgi:hypothetical protein